MKTRVLLALESVGDPDTSYVIGDVEAEDAPGAVEALASLLEATAAELRDGSWLPDEVAGL